jgi:hypothetical protein
MFKNRAEKEAFFKKFDEQQKAKKAKIKETENSSNKISTVEKAKMPEKPKDAGADYFNLIKVYQITHKCSWADAILGVNRVVPDIQEKKAQWLESVNREKEASKAPRSVAKVDGKDFPEMVEDLKLNHGMTTIEAQRYIDRRWPGLRQSYIARVNE